MKSIKNKLLIGIILINSLILIGIGIFKFEFEDFYIKYSSRGLNQCSKKIEELINTGNYKDLANIITKYSEGENISIEIYDESDLLLFTKGKNKNSMHKKNKFLIKTKCKVNKDLESYIIVDKSQGIEFLATITTTKDNLYSIVCKTPISAIKNSVDIASNFLLIIFIPIITLSVLMAIWFSNKFTKPIIELTKISNNIANLEFNKKSNIATNDEIEELGNSINLISSAIEKSMNSLKLKNSELEKLIENKNKEEKLKKEFVSSVSHELKTPITVINGYAEGLRSNILDSKEDKEYYIDVICEESEKMGLMVNDLLDLYKLESNTFKINKEKVNVEELITKVVKKHEFIINEKKINVSLNLKEIYILCDKIRIEQVLNNLLDNAINHISNKKIIKIQIQEINEYINICIYNSGERINENDLEKIWHSFVRLDKVRSSNENRVGLGLAIVREIISLHNGRYGVENVDDGVVFYIELKK